MRFLVDMPLSPVSAQWLSDKGHDAVHAAQRGLERADDATIRQRFLCPSNGWNDAVPDRGLSPARDCRRRTR
jgi:hypothetical protein